MDTGDLLFWIIPILLNLFILLWWRYNCENDSTYLYRFPSRGYIVIFILLSIIPIVGAIEFCIFMALYISFRIGGYIKLKNNKFNNFWFDVNE